WRPVARRSGWSYAYRSRLFLHWHERPRYVGLASAGPRVHHQRWARSGSLTSAAALKQRGCIELVRRGCVRYVRDVDREARRRTIVGIAVGEEAAVRLGVGLAQAGLFRRVALRIDQRVG